jgi:hypothetical protein
VNYELAKQLKDAGFPQHDNVGSRFVWPENPDPEKTNAELRIYIPTLEELIEACGERFYQLTCVWGDDHGNEQWEAIPVGHLLLQKHYKGEGSTPTEAVGRLFIALNKKV